MKLLKTQQDKEQFVFWIETLRAEVLPQWRGKLQSVDGYCCLGVGVACLVRKPVMDDGLLYGAMPYCHKAPLWLREINDHCGVNYDFSPVSANDSGMSHPEIADKLWELYKHEL